MKNAAIAAAVAMMAAAKVAMQEYGAMLRFGLGRNNGNYQRPPRPRKYQRAVSREGVKSLDAKNYEKRYGLGFRYKVGSKPFSAQR